MTTHKDLAIRALELTDRADFAGREALMTEDVEFQLPGHTAVGRAASTAYSAPLIAAFPDSHHHCALVVEEGDTVVVEGVWTGTHTQPLAFPQGEIPPTGAAISLPFSMLVRFEGDRAASLRVYFDQMAFMGQLTNPLTPEPAAASV